MVVGRGVSWLKVEGANVSGSANAFDDIGNVAGMRNEAASQDGDAASKDGLGATDLALVLGGEHLASSSARRFSGAAPSTSASSSDDEEAEEDATAAASRLVRSTVQVQRRSEYVNAGPPPLICSLNEFCAASSLVRVSVYDAMKSEKMAAVNTVMYDILQIGGVLHTGVEVYGREYCYGFAPGGSGIICHKPRTHDYHKFRRSVPLGYTALSEDEVLRLLRELRREWRGRDYKIIHQNCNSFSSKLVETLGLQMPGCFGRIDRAAALVDKGLEAIANRAVELDEQYDISETGKTLARRATVAATATSAAVTATATAARNVATTISGGDPAADFGDEPEGEPPQSGGRTCTVLPPFAAWLYFDLPPRNATPGVAVAQTSRAASESESTGSYYSDEPLPHPGERRRSEGFPPPSMHERISFLDRRTPGFPQRTTVPQDSDVLGSV